MLGCLRIYYFKKKKSAFKYHLEVDSKAEQLWAKFAMTEVWDWQGILRHCYDINRINSQMKL